MKGKLIISLASLLLLSYPALSQERCLYSKVGIQSSRANTKIPDFCLEGLNGKRVQLRSLKSNVILLNFWATWCGPCKEEMPSVEALYQHYKERDFVLLTISVDEGSSETTRKFIQKNRYSFPVLLDPGGKTLDLFQIDRIPAMVVIDKKGRILGRAIGSRDWSRPEVFSFIDQVLGERPIRVVSSKD